MDYRLTGEGWCAADVSIGEQRAHLTASYLSDALGDVVRAGADIAAGASTVRVTWAEEPGCYLWKFDLHGVHLELEIWWYADDAWLNRGHEHKGDDGHLVLYAECEASALCGAIAAAAHTVLTVHGVDGYLRQWGLHSFPADDLRHLDELIA